MDPLTDIDPSRFPRPVRWLSIAALGFLLTLAFALWLFPYPRLAGALSDRSEVLAGIPLQFNDLGPTFGFGGFGIEATQVRAKLPRGETLVIPRIAIRPAFSFGWLVGEPSVFLDLEGGGLGNVRGLITFSAGGGFDGSLERIALALLPLEQALPNLHMEGHVSGEANVAIDATGQPQGRLNFEATEGIIHAPEMPIGIPFKTFIGKLDLGGEDYAVVEILELTGPMLYARAVGTIGRSDPPGNGPLDMELELKPIGRAITPALQDLGIDAKPGKPTTLQITGTLLRPTFR